MGKQTLCACFLLAVISAVLGDDIACGPNQPRIINAQYYPRGNFYSPGYEKGENYPNPIRCSYQIQTQNGNYIRLKFNDMDIEVSDYCSAAGLTIYDFDSGGTSYTKAILCGNHTVNGMISRRNFIHLIFQTNSFNSKKGFNITYSNEYSPDLCPSNTLECRNRNCVEKSLKCNGRDDCGDATDEEKCGNPPVTITDCGNPVNNSISSDSIDRIVGGQEATPGSWPWMADLQWGLVEPNGHTCGGTLINAQWVLTAAHCFGGFRSASQWRIHLGNHNKFKKDPHEQIRTVERLIIFDDIPSSEFESNGEFDLVNDVALLKLNAPVNITAYVRPACLPSNGAELATMASCYATGWGVTRGTGSASALKQAYHPIQAGAVCTRLVGWQFNAPTMICAGTTAPLNGVCHGDSGGPLVCKNLSRWYVYGIASYVTDTNYIEGLCGLSNRPSVFNKVSAKISYINKMLNKYS